MKWARSAWTRPCCATTVLLSTRSPPVASAASSASILVKTLEAAGRQEHPQTVIVEASGVATPGGVWMRSPTTVARLSPASRSVGVLDPTRLEALADVMTPLVESQVADVEQLVSTKGGRGDRKDLELAASRRAAQQRCARAPGLRSEDAPRCRGSPGTAGAEGSQ